MLRGGPRTLLVSLMLGLVGTVLAAAAATAQQPITINLSTQNNSGMSGTAVLTPMGNQTRVTLNMTGAPGPHPAHIHVGQCPNVGAVVAPLTSVQGGTSETTVNMSIDQIRAARHAINVHKSPQEASVYVACGDLPLAAAGAGGGGTGTTGGTGGGGADAGKTSGGMPGTGMGGSAGVPTETVLGLGALLLVAGGTLIIRRRLA